VVIALALPAITAAGAPFPARGLTIFITFGVVFATLVLQGLTVKPLVRLLGLDGDNEPAREEAHARQVLAKAGLRRLEELAGLSSSSTEILEHFRQRQRRLVELWSRREELLRDESIAHLSANDGDGGAIEAHSPAYRRLRAAMIAAERHAAVELCEGGLIGTELLRRLQRDLDLETIVLGDAAHDRQDPEPRQQEAVFR
jgi:CPA1 family monovalent cation:H+ antiporter